MGSDRPGGSYSWGTHHEPEPDCALGTRQDEVALDRRTHGDGRSDGFYRVAVYNGV